MIRGIRSRIISTYLFLILISMAVLGILLIWIIKEYNISNLKLSMTNEAKLVSELVYDRVQLGDISEVNKDIKIMGRELNARITLVHTNGKVIGDSFFEPGAMDNHRNRPEIREALQGRVGSQIRFSESARAENLYVAVPIIADNFILGAVRLAIPLKNINITLTKLLSLLFSGILAATLLGVFLSVKLAKGLTEPIENINAGAKKIASGNWDTRVYSGSGDEIAELGNTINFMTKTLKEHIEEVAEGKSRMENIVSAMASGVIVLDNYGMVKIVNRAAEEMLGISLAAAEEKHILEVIRHFGLNDQIEKCLIQEKTADYEIAVYYPKEKIIKCYIAPVYREKTVAGITVVFHDITQIRKLEQMRVDFVANASHELRTPLTVIKGYAETLLGGALNDRPVSEKFVSVIDQEADRLQRLVNELLTLSKLESYQTVKDEQSVDLISLIQEVANEIGQSFSNKEISLSLELPQRINPVKANEDRIKQVMVNLLENALKFTPKKGWVCVSVVDAGVDIKVCVKDTGIGIPQEELPRVFERFYRVDKARSRQLGGFGLGLSITKHIVEAYGGKMGVESTLGEGSIFWFTLPKHE